MPHPFLPQLPFEDSVTGGPLRITFPTGPAAPAPTTPVPAAPLPTPSDPVVPAPAIEDELVFNPASADLGTSVEELYELLGLLPDDSTPLVSPIFGEKSIYFVDGGALLIESPPTTLGGNSLDRLWQQILEGYFKATQDISSD